MIEPLATFIDASPSPLHAALTVEAALREAGFTALDPAAARWDLAPGGWYVRRGAAVIAWRLASTAAPRRFAIVGAHTDSPHLRLKPRAPFACEGCRQFAVEVYGGVLLNSWLDRDLGLAGSLVTLDGTVVPVLLRRPLARVPQLAIHLDRGASDSGLKLNPNTQLNPIWGLGDASSSVFRQLLAEAAQVPAQSIASHDLSLFDLTPATVGGAEDELLFAARLDNLCSVHAGLGALLYATESGGGAVPVFAAFDHEEVGSNSRDGADGVLLSMVLERLVLALGGDRQAFLAACAGSTMISADMAHAVHPNYADRHDANHRPRLGGGPVLKTNHNQRYATSAAGAARILGLARTHDLAVQDYAARNDLGCGSTIGPSVAAALGMAVIDLGAPMLSMHSARECMAVADLAPYRRLLGAFLASG